MRYRLLTGILLVLTLTGCYLPLGGRVIDAETNEPIEGAIVVVEWTITKGIIGLQTSTVYKIAETETNKKGKFSLPGAYHPFVNHPRMVIYKQGYVAWRNDAVLRIQEKENGKIETLAEERTDYDVWEHGYLYKLERFKEGYSHYKNYLMMTLGITTNLMTTPKLEEALRYESQASEPELEILRREWRGR